MVLGTYTTTATMREDGSQEKAITVGESWNINSHATGEYTTTALNNAFGTLESQDTAGIGFSYIEDVAGTLAFDAKNWRRETGSPLVMLVLCQRTRVASSETPPMSEDFGVNRILVTFWFSRERTVFLI